MIFIGQQGADEANRECAATARSRFQGPKSKELDQDADFFLSAKGKGKQMQQSKAASDIHSSTPACGKKIHKAMRIQTQPGTSERFMTGRESIDTESQLDVEERRASRETTYISWSSSNREETSHQPSIDSLEANYGTPESVRVALKETGVFDDIENPGKGPNSDMNTIQEAATKLANTEPSTRPSQDKTPNKPKYEDKGVMAVPGSQSSSKEQHTGTQSQERAEKNAAEDDLSRSSIDIQSHARTIEYSMPIQTSSAINGNAQLDQDLSCYNMEGHQLIIPNSMVFNARQSLIEMPAENFGSNFIRSDSKAEAESLPNAGHHSYHQIYEDDGLSQHEF